MTLVPYSLIVVSLPRSADGHVQTKRAAAATKHTLSVKACCEPVWPNAKALGW